MTLRLFTLGIFAIAAIASMAACDCDDDERGTFDVVVPEKQEANWQSMACHAACNEAWRVEGLIPPREFESCQSPIKKDDGRLHLTCNWIIRRSCEKRL